MCTCTYTARPAQIHHSIDRSIDLAVEEGCAFVVVDHVIDFANLVRLVEGWMDGWMDGWMIPVGGHCFLLECVGDDFGTEE